MAIGGSLRAALRAGNWAKTAVESRRRARALANLNARGGLSGRHRNTLDDVYTVDDIPGQMGGGLGARSTTPDGRTVFRDMNYVNDRMTYNPDVLRRGYNPIEAPYEGFRVWPYGSRPAFEAPRWRTGPGRSSSRAPGVDARLYDDGFGSPASYDYGSIDFRPYNPMPMAEMNVPRVFGGFDPFYSNNASRISRAGRTIPFEEIMAAQGSLIPPRVISDVPF